MSANRARRPSPQPRPSGGPARPPARRRRHRVFSPWMLMIPIILLVMWIVLNHIFFVVRNVEVVGAGDYAQEAVVRASGIRLGTRLNQVDASAIQANVDATGVLTFVSLQRRYPVTLRLTVRQRSRDALVLQAGKALILDSDGYVVSAADTRPEEDIPYVSGLRATTYRLGKQLDATPQRLQAMKAVLEALKDRGLSGQVSELRLDEPNDIQLITTSGMTVLLGNADNMAQKIVWMEGTLRDLISRGQTLGKLDVSSGTKADYLPMVVVTQAPAPTQNTYLLNTPTPEPTSENGELGMGNGE